MSNATRAKCAVCGRWITVKRNGTMRKHSNPNGPHTVGASRIWNPTCEGVGLPPAAVKDGAA